MASINAQGLPVLLKGTDVSRLYVEPSLWVNTVSLFCVGTLFYQLRHKARSYIRKLLPPLFFFHFTNLIVFGPGLIHVEGLHGVDPTACKVGGVVVQFFCVVIVLLLLWILWDEVQNVRDPTNPPCDDLFPLSKSSFVFSVTAFIHFFIPFLPIWQNSGLNAFGKAGTCSLNCWFKEEQVGMQLITVYSLVLLLFSSAVGVLFWLFCCLPRDDAFDRVDGFRRAKHSLTRFAILCIVMYIFPIGAFFHWIVVHDQGAWSCRPWLTSLLERNLGAFGFLVLCYVGCVGHAEESNDDVDFTERRDSAESSYPSHISLPRSNVGLYLETLNHFSSPSLRDDNSDISFGDIQSHQLSPSQLDVSWSK